MERKMENKDMFLFSILGKNFYLLIRLKTAFLDVKRAKNNVGAVYFALGRLVFTLRHIFRQF